MPPRFKSIFKFLISFGIAILVLTTIIQIVTNDGRSFYYEPRYRAADERNLKIPINEQIFTDKPEKVPDDSEWLTPVQKELPYVPFDFWLDYNDKNWKGKSQCNYYPYLFGLDYHNTYWQTYRLENITFQLYGAYYDNRPSLDTRPAVRLLAMLDQFEKTEFPPNYCQLWFDDNVEPTIVPVMEHLLMFPSYWNTTSDNLYPYLITCTPLSGKDDRVPRSVSLVRSNCETAKNNLRVLFEVPAQRPPRNDFAVCVKGLYFPYVDNSALLVEWLELQRILGASKVYMYHFATHPNVSEVLEYYQSMKFIEVQQITLAKGEPNLKHYMNRVLTNDKTNKRLNEFIIYNDCFYRHMYKHAYLAAIDIDEVIMPLEEQNGRTSLMKLVEKEVRKTQSECPDGLAAICFENSYFPDVVSAQTKDVPSYFNMLRRTRRLRNHTVNYGGTKCLHNTAKVHIAHNHAPLAWLKSCRPLFIDTHKAQLNHYRIPMSSDNKEEEPFDESKDLVDDTNILRFKHALMTRTRNVLRELGFLKA